MMVGAAAVGAASQVTGEAVESTLRLFAPKSGGKYDLPHLVLVIADVDGVQVHASDRDATLGPELLSFPRGKFRAQLHHYPGEVDLALVKDAEPMVWLRGKRGPVHMDCMHTARKAVLLSVSNDKPAP